MKKKDTAYSEISPTQRAFEVVEIIAREGSATIAEIITVMAMPRTTAHRIVNSLEEQGYVYKARARGRYVVAPRLVELAANTQWAARTLSPAPAAFTVRKRVGEGTRVAV